MELFDAAIIGTGPAGLSAALNLKIHQKNFIWIGSKSLSQKVAKAERISSYPSFTDVSGEELTHVFLKQVQSIGVACFPNLGGSHHPPHNRYRKRHVLFVYGMVFLCPL